MVWIARPNPLPYLSPWKSSAKICLPLKINCKVVKMSEFGILRYGTRRSSLFRTRKKNRNEWNLACRRWKFSRATVHHICALDVSQPRVYNVPDVFLNSCIEWIMTEGMTKDHHCRLSAWCTPTVSWPRIIIADYQPDVLLQLVDQGSSLQIISLMYSYS
jgi:hypothetical protein